MCEVMLPDGTPHPSNTRAGIPDDPGAWFGFEQEYFLFQDGRPVGWPDAGYPDPQGEYYCGVGNDAVGDIARQIVEEQIDLCIAADINHEGINAEVAKGQWEFQIFGKGSANCADQMWTARYLLERCAESAGFRCKRFLVWRTGHQMSNAAVMGFASWHRSVLFTDLLLAQLGPRQLAAVFGHEMGHVLRHHVLVFAAWSLGFFLAGDVLLRATDVEDPALLLAGVTAFVAFWALGFGYMSRRFELDADLVALELTGDPEALASALDTVAGAHARGRGGRPRDPARRPAAPAWVLGTETRPPPDLLLGWQTPIPL